MYMAVPSEGSVVIETSTPIERDNETCATREDVVGHRKLGVTCG